MKSSCRRSTLLLLILTAVCHPLFSEERVLLPEEESPASFYEVSLGSEDVDLFLAGSWKAEISASASFGWSGGAGFNPDLGYPGLSDGFSFSQSPDLTVSLLVLEKLLFESAFTDDFSDSTFRLGYIGSEDEFVKIVSAGNMGINMSDRTAMSDYFYIPGGGPSSFGIYSLFAGPASEHELLFRFDPQQELRKLYLGSDILVEIEKKPSEYLRGRLFYVPGSPDDSLFYTEAAENLSDISDSEGRFYRKLAAEEYSYSASDGRLFTEFSPEGSVLVYSASSDWSDLAAGSKRVSTGSGEMLVLYEPGTRTDFEALSAYKIDSVLPDDEWKTRVFLAEQADSVFEGLELSAEILSEPGIVILSPAAGGSRLYPLEGILPEPEKIYGTTAVSGAETSGRKLWFRIRETASAYTLDNPVPGSIRVYINGSEQFGWSESGGAVTFDHQPAATDRIEIVYRKNTGSQGGDLLFASANRFTPSEGFLADIEAGVRWNIADGWALPGEETAAWGGLSAGFEYSSPEDSGTALNIDADVRGGIRILTENSTGRLLLKDMSATALDIALNRNTIFPSSLSERIAFDEGITKEQRGLLIYKDYRIESGVAGYFLSDYTTDIADEMIYSPDASTASAPYKAGPYTASAASDGRTGEIAVIDYALDSAGNWVGFQIPLNPGGGSIDLSEASALSFDYKTDSDLSDIELFVEIGSVSEDLDGDGKLDAESSSYSSGFIFDDPNTAAGTLIGGDNLNGSNGRLDTEDMNASGFLDHDREDAVAYFSSVPDPDADWNRLRLYFTDADGDACRAKLKNSGFIRITAVKKAGAAESGRIMFGSFRVEGSSFAASDTGGYQQPQTTEIYEALVPSAEKASAALTGPTVSEQVENRLMRIEWTDDWKLHSYIPAVGPSDYGSISFSYHIPEISPSAGETPQILLNLLDSSGKGLKAALPVSAGDQWHSVRVTIPAAGGSGTAEIDGRSESSAVVGFDTGAGLLSLLEISVDSADSGIIYIDEIYLGDPALNTLGGFSAGISAAWDKPLLSVGDFNIIGPVRTEQNVSADFILSEEVGPASIDYAAGLQTELLGAGLSADFQAEGPDTYILSGGHSLEIPLPPAGLLLRDSFHIDNTADGDFLRAISADLNTGFFSTGLEFSAVQDAERLNRRWFADAAVGIDAFGIGLSADFLLSDDGTGIKRSGYFGSWYSASALAADFTAAEMIQRKTSFDFSTALTGGFAGFDIEAVIGSNVGADNTAADSAELTVKLPVSFGEGASEVRAELGYGRRAVFEAATPSAGFDGDIKRMFASIGTGGLLYLSIPYYELFEADKPHQLFDSSTAAGFTASEYSSRADFTLSRNYSSRLTDLLLPYSVETALERTSKKDFEQSEDQLVLDLIWRSAALNLFGAAGVYPAFDFYFSDELNWSVETSVESPFSPEAESETLLKGGLSFFGHRDDILSVDFSAYIPFRIDEASNKGTAELLYIWNAETGEPINLPFFRDDEEMNQMLTSEEKLSMFFEDDFRCEFRHTTSLLMPGRFSLSAFGMLGYSRSIDSGVETSIIGLSLGLSGSIIY